MGRTTLNHTADHVGVSAKTVSNVVHGTGWVPKIPFLLGHPAEQAIHTIDFTIAHRASTRGPAT